MIERGCVHGRFQPAHKEHLKYIKEAKERCQKLTIGITQFDTDELVACAKDPHRAERMSNPLTYNQRVALITKMLLAEGIEKESFDFAPFPIDEPEKLKQFIPTNTVCYTTIRDEWNIHKNKTLESHGYKVIALWDSRGEETISASDIRELAQKGESRWREKVTTAVAEFLDSIDFEGQMRSLGIISTP